MDINVLRRGLLASMASSGMSIKTLTVTVDQSGITNAQQVAEFFVGKMGNPVALMSILPLDEITVTDEFISYESNYDGLFRVRNYRWRNSSNNQFNWAVANYDCCLVVGKRYECKFIA